MDTTFCVPEAYHIPSRSECLEATVKLASDWLQHSHIHVVNISCPAKYGHEYLLMELAQRIDTKVGPLHHSIHFMVSQLIKYFCGKEPTFLPNFLLCRSMFQNGSLVYMTKFLN